MTEETPGVFYCWRCGWRHTLEDDVRKNVRRISFGGIFCLIADEAHKLTCDYCGSPEFATHPEARKP